MSLVGHIEQAPDGRRVFRIIGKRDRLGSDGDDANVRPCAHPRFVLDDKWSTVTCEECKVKVDAYAALRVYAEWFDELRHRTAIAERQEDAALRQEVRLLIRRRAISDADRTRIAQEVNSWGKGLTLDYFKKLRDTLHTQIREAKRAKREQRSHD